MTTKLCVKCNEEFYQRQEINGKEHNLQRRKFCLKCSPFGKHNTRNLTRPESGYSRINGKHKPYNEWSQERKIKSIENLQLRRKNRKIEFIKKLGGKCEICGYSKNSSALHFHHKNPEDKEFELNVRNIAAYSLIKLEKELSKCQLLCSNCHSERHNPDCEIG